MFIYCSRIDKNSFLWLSLLTTERIYKEFEIKFLFGIWLAFVVLVDCLNVFSLNNLSCRWIGWVTTFSSKNPEVGLGMVWNMKLFTRIFKKRKFHIPDHFRSVSFGSNFEKNNVECGLQSSTESTRKPQLKNCFQAKASNLKSSLVIKQLIWIHSWHSSSNNDYVHSSLSHESFTLNEKVNRKFVCGRMKVFNVYELWNERNFSTFTREHSYRTFFLYAVNVLISMFLVNVFYTRRRQLTVIIDRAFFCSRWSFFYLFKRPQSRRLPAL